MKKSALISLILLCAGLTPIVALSDVGDVFTCNKNGQVTASAGSTTVLGGPYVPVADYAVELNTGLLAYKECVLREVVTSKRKAALATVDNQVLTQFNTGNGGGGYPSRELGREEVQVGDRTTLRNLQNDSLSGFNDAIEGNVKQVVARGYSNVRDPRKAFECEYQGDLNAVYSGVPTGNYWDAFTAVSDDPACSVFSAAELGSDALAAQDAYELYKNRERLGWGDGIYDVAHYDEFGFRITDTPGQMVLAQAIQSVQSPYKQAQEADDIGEMMDGLYLGVTNQVLTPGTQGSGTGGTAGSAGGLAAITQALGGALSYMQQVVQTTGSGYAETTGNATIGILQAALSTERSYNGVISSSASLLTQTISSLRAKENQCYTIITNAVCESGSVASSTCTGVNGGGTLNITTSTAFSQKVIDGSSNIRTLANSSVANLNTSNQIITRIQQLISGLAANPTQAAQAAALAALSAINPHNGNDVSSAQQNQQSLSTLMANVLTNTTTSWTESTDINTGWCNVNNQPLKDAWTSCWSGNSAACPTP